MTYEFTKDKREVDNGCSTRLIYYANKFSQLEIMQSLKTIFFLSTQKRKTNNYKKKPSFSRVHT